MKQHDRLESLFWFMLGIFICLVSLKLRVGTLHKPGAGFTPFLSGTVLGLSGVILFLTTLSGQFAGEKMGGIFVKGARKNPICVLFALFGYIILMEPAGFLVTTFVFLLFLFKISDTKRWLMPLIFSASTVVLSYLVFSVWLKLQFPKGILGF